MPSWGVLAVVAVRAMPARVALSPLTNAGQRGANRKPRHDLSRTTVVQHDEHQRDPTNAYDSAVRRSRKRNVIRENADERQRAPTGVGALITRRSQVQILPPPREKALVDRKIHQGLRRCPGPTSNGSSNGRQGVGPPIAPGACERIPKLDVGRCGAPRVRDPGATERCGLDRPFGPGVHLAAATVAQGTAGVTPLGL